MDYPSHRLSKPPPTPMLLDTCTLQHLKGVMDLMEEDWTWRPGISRVLDARFGTRFATELIALGELVQLLRLNGPDWVISITSWAEFDAWRGRRSSQYRSWWIEWASYADATPFPTPISRDALLGPPPVDPAPGQLALALGQPDGSVAPGAVPAALPFKDAGDRQLIDDALRSGTPAILTVDLRSFWAKRHLLYPIGLEVWRPSDLWDAIRPPSYDPIGDRSRRPDGSASLVGGAW